MNLGHIDEEYTRIFGAIDYPNLYSLQDDDYRQLRETIMASPRVSYSQKKLPFEDFYKRSNAMLGASSPTHLTEEGVVEDIPSQYDNSRSRIIKGLQEHVEGVLCGILQALSYKGEEAPPNNIEVFSVDNIEEPNIFSELGENPCEVHKFWISIPGRCKAYGYFEKEHRSFFIGKGSLISYVEGDEYVGTSSYRQRHRMIEKYGEFGNHYIKVRKDFKCRSAVAAARYVVGANVCLDLWKDSEGKKLYEVYPDIFFR